MLRETSATDVLIVGGGVAGLFLANFLRKLNIEYILIDALKDPISKIRDTGLLSENFIAMFPPAKRFIIAKYNTANFYLDKESFEIKIKNRWYYMLDRVSMNKYLLSLSERGGEISFGERIINIESNNLARTTDRNIKYKIIVDATGPYGYVRKLYGLNNRKDFVIGIEVYTDDVLSDGIHIFLDSKFSREYFLWIVGVNGYSKVGLIDKNLTIKRFFRILRNIGISEYSFLYSSIIKKDEEKILAYKNMISIGESTGYLKKFSLGGILISYLQAYLASIVIKSHLDRGVSLDKYNFLVKEILRPLKFSELVRRFIKKKTVFKFIKLCKLEKFARYVDLDFYLPFYSFKINPSGPGGI